MPITDCLASFVDRGTLAGAVVLVADRERVLETAAIGWADIAARAPMRTDALFWIASITKPITCAAAMMLVDEGRLRVEDPVEAYLPDFAGQQQVLEQDGERVVLGKAERPFTVAQAMAHTSGLPFHTRPECGKIDRLTLREAAIAYALSPLQFAPGTRYDYSNAGTNTVGRIVEVLSGQPFERFLAERLLEPLGMRETSFVPDRARLARLVTPHKPSPTGLVATTIEQATYPLDDPARRPSPAGGLFSTADDLRRFGQMLLAGGVVAGRRYLSADAVARMASKQTGDAVPAPYGFGLSIDPQTGGFGHAGALATNLGIEPRHGLVIVYLVQHAGYGDPQDGERILPTLRQAAIDRWSGKAGGHRTA